MIIHALGWLQPLIIIKIKDSGLLWLSWVENMRHYNSTSTAILFCDVTNHQKRHPGYRHLIGC